MPQAATATTKMENIVSSSQSHNAFVVSCCAVLPSCHTTFWLRIAFKGLFFQPLGDHNEPPFSTVDWTEMNRVGQ